MWQCLLCTYLMHVIAIATFQYFAGRPYSSVKRESILTWRSRLQSKLSVETNTTFNKAKQIASCTAWEITIDHSDDPRMVQIRFAEILVSLNWLVQLDQLQVELISNAQTDNLISEALDYSFLLTRSSYTPSLTKGRVIAPPQPIECYMDPERFLLWTQLVRQSKEKKARMFVPDLYRDFRVLHLTFKFGSPVGSVARIQ